MDSDSPIKSRKRINTIQKKDIQKQLDEDVKE